MTIFILALHGIVTGGPEATHQLSDALIEQGFDARLVYFKWDDLKNGVREFPAYAPFAPEYDRYKANLAHSIPDQEGDVVVIPETAAPLVQAWRKAKVLVWWLSVDNSFGALSQVNLNHLRKPNVFHACQSRYAERFIEALQFNSLGMLSDYTVDLTEYAQPMPMEERPKLVAFNARPDKVIADLPAIAQEIERLDPGIKIAAIGGGVPRAEIAKLFAQARVYVDLGTFPGKDRLPREAASMGCDVVTGLCFGACEEVYGWRDDPSPRPWRDDPALRSTAELVVERLQIAEPNLDYIGFGHIAKERTTFFAETRKVFTALNQERANAQETIPA
jgi:hypothetical protein